MDGEVAREKLYDAAVTGDVKPFEDLLEQDPHLLDRVSSACSNRTPLHTATLHGNVAIVREMLDRNPQLARIIDSEESSPLHIAAAEGHVEIASMLLAKAPKMCWRRDCQGMNPIHIAAMNGHVEILQELIQLDPFPARERLEGWQTVMHLCVKHRQLAALKLLVENLDDLVRAEDNEGETVLHLAVRYKQIEIIRYLVDSNKIDKHSRNNRGETALHILREISQDKTYSEMKKILINGISFTGGPVEFLRNMSDVITVVVVLIATMAFQAAVNPPGGVWQDDSSTHKAGEAVMASSRPKIYKSFVRANTVAFVSSLVGLFLLSTRLPSQYSFFTGAVLYTMWVSLTSIAVSYGASIMVITPDMEAQPLSRVIKVVAAACLSIFGIFAILLCLMALYTFRKSKWGK